MIGVWGLELVAVQGGRSQAPYSSRFYLEIESLAGVEVKDESLSGVIIEDAYSL